MGLDCQRMDTLAGNVTQSGNDHALALEARDASKGRAVDLDGEVRFAAAIVARMAAMASAIVDDGKVAGGEGRHKQLFHFECDWPFIHAPFFPYWPSSSKRIMWATMNKNQHHDRFHGRFHGRVGSGTAACAFPACREAGEFRAPNRYGRSSSAEGPGDFQLLCLDHIREFNAGYDWFAGMSAEEIAAAQSPVNVWASETRAFSASASIDAPPKWQDFHDPLDTISARFHGKMERATPRAASSGAMLNPDDRRALKTLGLGEDADRRVLRRRYSELLRKYHPDKNGGNRAHEKALQDVLAAYTQLKIHPAFN